MSSEEFSALMASIVVLWAIAWGIRTVIRMLR